MTRINIFSLKNNNEVLKFDSFSKENCYVIDEMHKTYVIDEMHKSINRTFSPIVQIYT